jgi:Immunity protein Imm1
MTTYHVGWGRGVGAAQVSIAAELDVVLDGVVVGPDGLPYSVSIVAPDGSDFPPMLEICVGHPERALLYHIGDDGSSAWGYQPDLPPGPAFLFDYGGVATEAWPERTRVTPSAARSAARRFITSGGGRPDGLSWDVLE